MIYRVYCNETQEVIDDGAMKIWLNTKGTVGEASDELKDLLKYIQKSTQDVVEEMDESSPIREIHRRVTEVKNNARLEGAFMTGQEWLDEQLEDMMEAYKKEDREAITEEVKEAAKAELLAMIQKCSTLEELAAYVKPIEKVE
ncbi:MAG: hypothetical protein R3Y47_04720 [Lachnospiraceae bacterium]